MEKIKTSAIAGSFYPADKNELENLISKFSKPPYDNNLTTRAVIVPHAGLIFSGNLAFQGLNLLDKNIKKLMIFAPCHRVAVRGLALSEYDKFQTPFGDVSLDKDTIKELNENFGASYNDEALKDEHAIEVLLPLIQKIFNKIEIIPVLVGTCTPEIITNIIASYYDNNDYGFVISSDLSHFLDMNKANEIDLKTANMIETGMLEGFTTDQACGAFGIYALAQFAKSKQFSLIRVGITNSAAVNGDSSRVVGYGAWALYEDNKYEFLKKYYSEYILNIARSAIEKPNQPVNVNYLPIQEELGATFVTLTKNGMLRGCIGSIIAHRPLIYDLVTNARNSAYSDTRFNPVSQAEFSQLEIAVSLLTAPVKMHFKDEEDLLNQIVKDEDGIIIADMGRQAVYLPSVWEQISDKKMFLNTLKLKAGLPENHFSSTFEAYRYKTIYIK